MDTFDLPLDPALDIFSDLSEEEHEAAQDALLEGRSFSKAPRVAVPPDQAEAIRATYVSNGGNVAMVARVHDVAPRVIATLASEQDWPVYGDGDTHSDKSRKTRLRNMHDKLEQRVNDLLESMEVETKAREDIAEKGVNSKYVAALSQRSGAFKNAFDAYVRVGAMLMPELYDRASQPMSANGLRRNSGGVEGVNREIEDFIARVSVGLANEIVRQDRGQQALDATRPAANVITIEPEDSPDDALDFTGLFDDD